jgi:hypothetical protein
MDRATEKWCARLADAAAWSFGADIFRRACMLHVGYEF